MEYDGRESHVGVHFPSRTLALRRLVSFFSQYGVQGYAHPKFCKSVSEDDTLIPLFNSHEKEGMVGVGMLMAWIIY